MEICFWSQKIRVKTIVNTDLCAFSRLVIQITCRNVFFRCANVWRLFVICPIIPVICYLLLIPFSFCFLYTHILFCFLFFFYVSERLAGNIFYYNYFFCNKKKWKNTWTSLPLSTKKEKRTQAVAYFVLVREENASWIHVWPVLYVLSAPSVISFHVPDVNFTMYYMTIFVVQFCIIHNYSVILQK